MPWELTAGDGTGAKSPDPELIREVMETRYDCSTILYPVLGGDRPALAALLEDFVQPQFLAAGVSAAEAGRTRGSASRLIQPPRRERSAGADRDLIEHWVHGGVPVDNFTGREEELARLDRWATDREVRLIGVTAWGGAGKTALVTEWLQDQHQPRPVRGIFGWSFYENPSAEKWAYALLAWAAETFDYKPGKARRLSVRSYSASVKATKTNICLRKFTCHNRTYHPGARSTLGWQATGWCVLAAQDTRGIATQAE